MLRALISVLLSLTTAVHAGELEQLSVERRDKLYMIDLTIVVEANTDAVMAILVDHARLTRISRMLTKSEFTHQPPDKIIRMLTFDSCIAFFCAEFDLTDEFYQPEPGKIVTTFIPEQSDVKSGLSEWSITAAGLHKTRIRVHTELESDFWILPFIGTILIKAKLRREAKDIIAKIEANAGT